MSNCHTEAKQQFASHRHWIDREILATDLSDANRRMGTRVDGFLGEGILREFSSVGIDYKSRVLEQ